MKQLTISEKEMGVREECGIIGIMSKNTKDIAREVYFGLFALQHRGQESAGIAVRYNKDIFYYKNTGLVSYVFEEEELALFPASSAAIGHARYAAKLSNNIINAQPLVVFGKFGRMAIAHNGSIVNEGNLKQSMVRQGFIFQTSTDAETIVSLINGCSAESVEECVYSACRQLKGAFAFVILVGDKMIAARDSRGLKPAVMGEKDGDIIIASESCALDALGANLIRDLEPGEIVIIDSDCKVTSKKFSEPCKRACIFEYVYLARADSVIDDVSVYRARYECGQTLAKLCNIDADIVSGVPDSALVAAKGYADYSGIPFVDALSKNRYIGRTFIQPSQVQRENSVQIKLTAFRNNIKGKRLILIDDSIVRGTTSKKIINLLRQNGASEVHMVIASPIVRYPCYFGVDMKTRDQLIGSYIEADEICKKLGADSLHYIPLEGLRQACGGGEFCTGCFNGEYAMDVLSDI